MLVCLNLLCKQLNPLPQLVAFYVVPLYVVYNPLLRDHMLRLCFGIWAPGLVQQRTWCMFPPRVLLPPGTILQDLWQMIASIYSNAWDD